jgi:membrane protein YdbS with pleckstrin-like domain
MSEPRFSNLRAATWTPRRVTALLAVMLLAGVTAALYGFVWSSSTPRSIVLGILGVVLVVCDLYMYVLAVTKQGWAWLFRKDNTTTKPSGGGV